MKKPRKLRAEVERLMDVYWGLSGHNRPEKRPIYSEAILSTILKAVEDRLPERDMDGPNADEYAKGHASGYNLAIDQSERAIKKLKEE